MRMFDLKYNSFILYTFIFYLFLNVYTNMHIMKRNDNAECV